ncbi:cbiO protein [Lactobacillus selangorensis]|uniref:Energy-coupling factor transporter ATP-binding protein EcfA2 n=1 Tax=Lactobacillus selangorensis TaxID=81857 RepID=A0A0R2FT40_9LACO|nr:energy-coupling factor ABC transporter ATP-binding protein [Lactobacillus selangorensis]KRN29162.1 cbiO protein [Lactobacillus selangorensis]KRN31480.1 cbiO protein [Lactobacillus selangorensis]
MDITFTNVDYTYQANTPFQGVGLRDINLTIHGGSYTAIIGHTGSGKSTLLQHLNALLKPTAGTVQIGDRTITPATNNKNLKPIRQKVGMVFQFPESQLFEETVLKDIAFGPQNFGMSADKAHQRAEEMAELVGLPKETWEQSPFDLSGGQMRRVAIAGVLAMQPEYLVLDEPSAGLDPLGRQEMMDLFNKLHRENGLTIVLVTHQMDDVANYADQVVVMEHGQVIRTGTPREIFANEQWLVDKQLGVPKTTHFAEVLKQQGFQFEPLPLTEDELVTALLPQLLRQGGAANE